MIIIDLHSRTPIYEQIEEQIIYLINTGVYAPGDKLPSIRALAGDLGLNVNTVKRAFAELEARGMIVSYQGRGVFVSAQAVQNEVVLEEARRTVKAALLSAKTKGVTKEEIKNILDSLFETGD